MTVSAPDATDLAYLERAATLARLGWGRVHPNPTVGCVLVRDGEVVAEGYHERFGGPHAEVVALSRAGEAARGATAYVSLEPCDHQGKTPPCSTALVDAGVARVVFGAADPGEASGGGAETLRAGGVEVAGPLWEPRRARAENPAFHHSSRSDTPYVAVKLAVTLDARIAARPGVRTRITGDEADREVHRLRSGHDAVMIGAGTLRADDPRLTVRGVEPGPRPTLRMVLLSDPTVPPDAALFDDVSEAPVWLWVPEDADPAACEALRARGAEVLPAPRGAGGLDLDAVLAASWSGGVRSILCEGGASLAGSLLAADRVQRLHLFIAPRVVGGDGLDAFSPAAATAPWDRFEPVLPPTVHGRDTQLVLDRVEG